MAWDWNQELQACECGDDCTGDLIGLDRLLCPACNAHLAKFGICLNVCHLGTDGQKRFTEAMKEIGVRQ